MTARTMDLSEAIAHTVEGMGYEFVELERLPGSMLRVTIDTEQEGGISVNDCEAVSNQLTALFAAEDVDYTVDKLKEIVVKLRNLSPLFPKDMKNEVFEKGE